MIVIILFLILQITKLYWIQEFREEHGEGRIEYLACNGSKIDYEEIVKSTAYQSLLPVVLKQRDASISKIDTPTVAIGVTAQYIQLEHLQMVAGSFIVEQAVQEERNVVVISEEVAIKLFRTTNVVGKTLECNGQRYKIVGVYKKEKHIWESICDTGNEEIFIPITDKMFEEVDAKQLIINKQYIKTMPNKSTFDKLGLSDTSIREYNYSKWIVKLKSISRLPIILIGVLICIFIDKRIWNQVKTKEWWKQQIHKNDWREILYLIIISLLAIGINGVVIGWSISNFYIDPSNLPPENIFDLSFYWTQLCSKWSNENLYMKESISGFGNLFRTFKKIIHNINLIQYIGLTIILGDIRIRINRKNQRL